MGIHQKAHHQEYCPKPASGDATGLPCVEFTADPPDYSDRQEQQAGNHKDMGHRCGSEVRDQFIHGVLYWLLVPLRFPSGFGMLAARFGFWPMARAWVAARPSRGCKRDLVEAKAVRHAIRSLVARVELVETERVLTEPDDTDVGEHGMGNVGSFGVRAEGQATHARPVTELRAVRPGFDPLRDHVVEPAAPIVPGDEDRGLGPQAALHHGVDLVHGPLHAVGDISDEWIV